MAVLLPQTPQAMLVSQDTREDFGQAHMEADGTVILDMRISKPDGSVGDERIAYKIGNPHYQELLSRLGGLKPGEYKAVPPWRPWKR